MSDAAALARPTSIAGRFSFERLGGVTLAAVLYALVACLAYWPVSPFDAHHVVGCACSDPIQEVWFLNWTSFALQHALNPFFTSYMLVPHGANLGANTFMPLLGLVGMPITLTLGPIAAYNLLLRLAFAASGLSMFLVLRRYTSWYPAALVGGLLFELSPFMVVHGQRHLFLVFLPLLPPMIPVIDDWLLRPRRSPVASGLLLGLLAGLEYLVSPEVLLATGLMAVVALAVLALKNPHEVRSRIKPLVTGSLVAIGLLGIIAGYPIWMLLFGPQHTHGPPHPVANLDSFREDLLSTVIPSDMQLIAPHAVESLAAIPPLIFENGSYLGLPLLALLVYLSIRWRHDSLIAIFAVVGGVAAILSLGTELQVGGHRVFGVMPFRILAHIPILQSLEPARFTLFVQLAAVLILARGMDRVWREGWVAGAPADSSGLNVPRAFGMAIVGAVVLVPLIPGFPYRTEPVNVPALFTSSQVNDIPQDAKVFTYPYDYPPYNDPMSWQVASGMRFRIFGGDAFVPLPKGVENFQTKPRGSALALQVLLDDGPIPPPNNDTVNAVRRAFRLAEPQVVLLDTGSPDAGPVGTIFERVLRARPRIEGGMEIWTNVGADLRPH